MKDTYLRANGLTFPALSAGDGQPVILLHGFPDCYRNWEQQVERLAEAGCAALAPALRGYDPQCQPDDRDYSLAAAVDDLLEISEQQGGPVHLVGHDWGAVVAYLAAARSPDHFRSLTTLAIPPLKRLPSAVVKVPEQLVLSAYMEFFQLPSLPEWWCRRNGFSGIETLWRRWSPDWDPEPWLSRAKEALAEPGVLKASLAWYRNMPKVWTPANREVLSWMGWNIQVPTLVMMGRKDGCMSEKLLRHTIVDRDFTAGLDVEQVAGAGHFLHLERPERVSDLILRHIRTHA